MGIAPYLNREVAVNPSVSGLAGAKGDVVFSTVTASAWVKFGDGATDWQAFPGGGGADVRLLSAARVVATSNITLNDVQSIDGITLVAGNRVLAVGQTDATQNGAWVVVQGGAWTRPTDFDADADLVQGQMVPIMEGAQNAGSIWSLATSAPTIAGSKSYVSTSLSCGGDAWGDMVGRFVASKVPAINNVVYRTRCRTLQDSGTSIGADIERNTLTGTGATCTLDTTKNGGVLKLTTGATGNSHRFARNVNGTNATFPSELVGNLRTSKWAVAVRVAMDAPTSGCTFDIARLGAEVANGTVALGVAGSVSATNWCITVGTAAAVDTGVALPAAGQFVTVVLIADGTNVSAWNVLTGQQIGTNRPQNTAVTNPAHWIGFITNTGAVDKAVYWDDVAVITEPAA